MQLQLFYVFILYISNPSSHYVSEYIQSTTTLNRIYIYFLIYILSVFMKILIGLDIELTNA